LDKAFYEDFGFGFRNLVNVQRIMSLWTAYNQNIKESPYYFATTEELAKVCSETIKGFDSSEIEKILDFLTLKPEKLTDIEGYTYRADDLPTWEYKKRSTRYSIRPLIRINEKYYWGPHSTDRAGRVWAGIPNANRLPADINAPNACSILSDGHKDLEVSLLDKIREIVKRYSNNVEMNVYPHKLIKGTKDIGDCDVLALLKDKNILINIESKIIDPAYCLKDIKRVREKIFGRTKTDGSFEGRDLQKVERRGDCLKQKGLEIINKLNWGTPKEPPKVVSIFCTQISFWWTKFPPVDAEVEFKEIRLLGDYIKSL